MRRKRAREMLISIKRVLSKKRGDTHFFVRLFSVLLCAAVLAVSSVGVYRKCGPIALGALENTVSGWLEELVNESVRAELESKKYKWDDFCTRVLGEDGAVSSISVDSSRISVFCADLVSRINGEIRSRRYVTIKVPIGSAIAPRYLSGRGFNVKIRAVPYVSVSAEVSSAIEEAGINQTLHRINVRVTSKVVAVCMSESVSFVKESKVLIAESLIVGNIPIVT